MKRSRSTRHALTLMIVGLAAACTGDATGLVNDNTQQPDAPKLESRWDMDITVRYVHSSTKETCDGKDLLGFVNPGEYQYRITAKLGSVTKSTESKGYGSVTGVSKALAPNKNWDFANQTWTFENMMAGDAVDLTMYVTEWDGLSKDSYMNNRSNNAQLNPSSLLPTGGTNKDLALGVGTDKCGLTLYYDVTARQRQVEVS